MFKPKPKPKTKDNEKNYPSNWYAEKLDNAYGEHNSK